MEFAFIPFLSQSLILAAFTLLCCAIGVFGVRLLSRNWKSQSRESVSGRIGRSAESDFASRKERKSCSCCCSCDGAVFNGEGSKYVGEKVANGSAGEMCEKKGLAAAVVVERQTGASMMEQLVPEITTHALSYLDYPSLCRLSMTNSLMRKAANDDNAWKTLYHKDFTMEQTSIKPPNGWKAYYAATRAIVNVNAEFFNIIRDRSLQAMSCFWLDADYVKCIHSSGELFTRYNAVMESWQMAFNWEQQPDAFHVLDVRVRVLTDMAWVTMRTYADLDAGPYNVTNVFECHNGRWYMVHHHSSLMLVDGDVNQQIVHA